MKIVQIQQPHTQTLCKINLLASFRSCDLLQAYKQSECGHTKGLLPITSPNCIMPDTCVNMAKATGIGNMGNVVQHSLYQVQPQVQGLLKTKKTQKHINYIKTSNRKIHYKITLHRHKQKETTILCKYQAMTIIKHRIVYSDEIKETRSYQTPH